MDVNEMLWTPHGSLSIRWEHGEPYHEAYGGIVPYEACWGCASSIGLGSAGRRRAGQWDATSLTPSTGSAWGRATG